MAENKLEIVISAKGAEETASNLTKLDKALSMLDNSLKGFKSGGFDKIVTEMNKLSGIKVSKTLANNLNSISGAVTNLAFMPNSDKIEQITKAVVSLNNIKIAKNLGSNLDSISEAVNKVSDTANIKGLTDIMQSLTNLNDIKISTTLGKSIENIVTSINKIDEVKAISPQLATNLDVLGKSLQSFKGLDNIQFSGVAQLTTALSKMGKIKPINDNIYKNVDKIAKAVISLNTQLKDIDDKRLKALASATKAVAPAMKQADTATKQWGGSLKLLNLDAFINLAQRAIRTMKDIVDLGSKAAFEYAQLQNSMSFYNQSLGSYAREQMQILQGYADVGAIDMDIAVQQIAAMNNMLIGFGHNSEQAAKMSRILYQVAVDASFAIGENGRDVANMFENLMSVMAGMPRSLYSWGVDTTVTAMIDGFDEATRSMTKLEKSTYAYMLVMQGTGVMQGQFSREFNLAATQQYVLQNKIKQSLAALGKTLQPVFLQIIKYAFILVRAIDMAIAAMANLFGTKYEQINFETMLGGMEAVNSAANASNGMAGNFEDSAKSAKEMKKYLAGFDDLNVMSITDTSGAIGGTGLGGLGDIDFGDYDLLGGMQEEMLSMFKEIDEQAAALYQTLKAMAPWVLTIGGAFLAWKIGSSLVSGVQTIAGLFGMGKSISTGTQSMETIGTGLASPKMLSIVKNFGLGLIVLTEIAAATVLLVGAVWLVGKELEQVGIAWQPVIDNAGLIAAATITGTLLIAGIGGATYLLGTLGTAAAINIGIGTLVMLEVGLATALFLAEIIIVGLLLQQVYNAWLPINDKAGPIATYIGIGTGLLVGIGVVTALLGAATVATAGTLPLAIGLGTGMLVLLAAAFVLFVDSLVNTANGIIELDNAIKLVNPILPIVKEEFGIFNSEMIGLATLIANFSKNQFIMGLQGFISNIVSFFAGSPIATHAKEIKKQADDTQKLYNNLLIANRILRKTIPELEENIRLMEQLGELQQIQSGGTNRVTMSISGISLSEISSSFSIMLIDWKRLWAQAWEDMANTASLSLKNINTPDYDMSGMYSKVRSQSNNSDVTSVLREVAANIIQAIYDSKGDDDNSEKVMVLDGKVLGRFYDEYVEDRNARTGRTIVR